MQATLQLVQQAYLGTQERAVVVLEGWDTAGKGGVYLLPANNKPYGRLAVFSILTDRLGQGVVLQPRPLDPKVAKAAARFIDPSILKK